MIYKTYSASLNVLSWLCIFLGLMALLFAPFVHADEHLKINKLGQGSYENR